MDIERCPQCQHQLSATDNFCASCGVSVSTFSESERSAQLVPDMPHQSTTSNADSTARPDGFRPTASHVRRFFEHEFGAVNGAGIGPWISTASVIVLHIITLGIWPVHYMKRLTEWLDDAQSEQEETSFQTSISVEFMAANFVFAYTYAVASLLSVSDPDNLAYYVFAFLIGTIEFVLHVVWAFKLRTRLQVLWHSTFQHAGLLSGFLTFVFGVIYLNFKIVALKTHNTQTPKA